VDAGEVLDAREVVLWDKRKNYGRDCESKKQKWHLKNTL